MCTVRPRAIRRIRAKLKLSQEAFAEELGVSVRTLQDWEQGRRAPNAAAIALLNRTAAGNKPNAKGHRSVTPSSVVEMLQNFDQEWSERDKSTKRTGLKLIGTILQAFNLELQHQRLKLRHPGLESEFFANSPELSQTDIETLKRARRMLADARKKLNS